MATGAGWEQLVMLDRVAAGLARGVGATMLLLGEALGDLEARGGHHALGFSSMAAYVQERCGRSARWARDVVRVAGGLARYPLLRRSVFDGEVTWSAAEVVLRALRALTTGEAVLAPGAIGRLEHEWVERARRLTVRELRNAVSVARVEMTRVKTAGTEMAGREAAGGEVACPDDSFADLRPYLRPLPTHVLTVTVRAETAWWLECAREVYLRSVGDCVGARSTEHFVLALLAEARVELEGGELGSDEAIARWGRYLEQRAAWRDESERRCDEQRGEMEAAVGGERGLPETDELRTELGFDRRVRELAAALTRRDVELGRLAGWLQAADAWRRLGFASEAHYVRERMGVSYSQWKSWRFVARRLREWPALEAAVWEGKVGFEAAALVLRVVAGAWARGEVGEQRGALEQAWLERASSRTFKHLREEVHAAEIAAQHADVPTLPPSEETMRRFLALRGRVRSGALLLEESGRAEEEEGSLAARTSDVSGRTSVEGTEGLGRGRMSVAGRAWLDLRGELRRVFRGPTPSGSGGPKACRRAAVRLRLRLERDTLVEFRCLERLFRRWRGGDFVEFLCRHFLAVWGPALRTDVQYAHIYRRDAFTCSSPVCERHDVQPHHLIFRSAGGGEDDENLTSLCTWCHLDGVHGGRIRVQPPASAMHWCIGPTLQVFGRELRTCP